jgi:hypothetical protein
MTITLRQTKGSELTHAELDGNFEDLDLRTAEGWSDMLAPLLNAGIPNQNAPTLAVFGPSPSQYQAYTFAANDYVFVQPFHVNHDIKPNGQAYIHVHWSTNGVSTNTVKWEFAVMRALGHDQANFGAVTTLTVEQAASGTAWRHMVAEVDATQTLTLTEPDEVILVVLKRVTNGATDNADSVYGLMVDFHYQTDRRSTPNRSPDFYA